MNHSVALFLALSVAFGIAFVADLRGHFNTVEDPVAVLQESGGTVRRLADKALTWDRAEQGTLFAARDTIATGESAGAKLAFYAGGEIELAPGTMVFLGGKLNELELNFVSGSARVRVTSQAKKKISIRKAAVLAPGISEAPSAPRVEVETVEAKDLDLNPAPTEEEIKEGKLVEAGETKITPQTQANQLEDEATTITKTIQEEEIRKQATLLAEEGELIAASVVPATPEIVFPPSEAEIDIGKDPFAKLQWRMPASESDDSSKLEQPRSYEILIRPFEGGRARILKSKQPRLGLAQLGTGKFKWSVRAVNSEGKRSRGAASRWFVVKKTARIKRPTVLPVRVE